MEREHLSLWELLGGLLSGEEGSGDVHHPMEVHSPGTLIVVRGLWKWGISLSMGALLGEPGGGLLC